MSIADVILIVLIAAALLLAVRSVYRAKKSGKCCSCSGDCTKCGAACDHEDQ